MKRIAMTAGLVLLLAASALAAPLSIDFSTDGYGPAPGTTQSATRSAPGVDLTFESRDAAGNPSGTLYWDPVDGFGTIGLGYEADEIEGDERFYIGFSESVDVLGFSLTDFFNEERNGRTCPGPGCYLETGAAMFFYADGSHSLFQVLVADPMQFLLSSNGVADFSVDEREVVGIMFAALGMQNGDHHEFSVDSVRFETNEAPPPAVPEPTSLVLMASGLGLVLWRHRRA
jgi:hypothetical protein